MKQIVRSSALILLTLQASALFAFQDPEIRVGTSADEIFAGESVDYTVEIRNLEHPKSPDISALKELFDVVQMGDKNLDESTVVFSDGRLSQSIAYRHAYRYRLTPKQTGDLQIPAPVATANGKKLTGRKLSLRVIEPERQDLVVVELKASQGKVYPTQPFTVTLTILVRPLPDKPNIDPLLALTQDPPQIEVNLVETPDGLSASEASEWLQPLLSRNSAGFTLNNLSSGGGFFRETAIFDLSSGRETREDLEGKSVRYFKSELSRTFTAERYGQYKFGPAVIKGRFVSGLAAEGYLGKKLAATSASTTVEVREVPTPRPANYCGGIGEFMVEAIASTTRLRVGDPLTLTLKVKRAAESGSLELISAPDLSAVEQLVSDFDLIDKDPTGRVDGQTKEFAYAIRPKRPDVSIPALTFSTFDPVGESFKEVSTLPIALEVGGSVGLSSSDLVGSLSPTNSSLKSRSEGIFQNITDPNALHDERVRWVGWSQVVAAVWAASGATCAIVLLRRRKSSDTVGLRRQQAKRTANKKIAEARNSLSRGDTQQAMRDVRLAVIGLIADSYNRVSEGLTTTDVEQLLANANVADNERRTIRELLESIEASEYGAGLSKDPSTTIEDASKWIARIAPLLEKRK